MTCNAVWVSESYDDEKIRADRTPLISAKTHGPQQQVVQVNVRSIVHEIPSSSLQPDESESSQAKEQCTPVATMKRPDLLQEASEVDDCCIVKETPPSNSRVGCARPNFSLLDDDCCIVKEIPSSSWRSLSSATSCDLGSQEKTVETETMIRLRELSSKPIEIPSIKEILKQIPPMEMERPPKRRRRGKRKKKRTE